MNTGREEMLPYVGPAAALPGWALLARWPYAVAAAFWAAILIAAALTVVLCALRLANARPEPLRLAAAFAFAFASAPILSALALGQAALVSAGGIAAALIAYRTRKRVAAVIATLLAALQPNLALVLIGRMRSRFDVIAAGCAAAIFAAATLAHGGLPGLRAYLARLAAHGEAERFVTIQHTPAAIAFALGAAPPLALTAGGAIAIAAAMAAVAIVVRERLDATTATLLGGALLPLAVPFFHEHDFVVEVLPILVLSLRATGRARVLSACAAVLLLVDWFGLAQRHGAQGQIVCLGFALALAFVALDPGRRPGRGSLAPIALLAALALVAVPSATLHPAPTWPDMLPAGFTADPASDASGAWAAQARAAGLIAPDAVWGGLRALPLLGCLVLAGALVADARRRRRTRGRIAVPRYMPPAAPPVFH